MVKATYEAFSLAIPKKELVGAAKKFWLRVGSQRRRSLMKVVVGLALSPVLVAPSLRLYGEPIAKFHPSCDAPGGS